MSQYILESIDPLTNERVSRGEFFISENLQNFDDDSDEAITIAAALMRATAAQNLNTPDPIFHFQLCLQPGETMTSEQFRDSVMHSLAGLTYEYRDDDGKKQIGSYADHQFVAGVHTDKAHTHAHVMVNRVHPDRLTAHTPEFYRRSLDKSCRELEHKHGWQESPGLFRWDRDLNMAVEVPQEVLEQRRAEKLRTRRGAEGKAAQLEYYGDEESILNKVRRIAAKPLRELCENPRTGWKEVHALLASYGFELHKSEMGGYTVEDVSTGTRVKASKAFRVPYHKKGNVPGIPGAFCGKKNRQATEDRLGAWEPMSAEIRAGILKQPLFQSHESWARQTGGFQVLSKQDQESASAAFMAWQQQHGANSQEITTEKFVVNCQRPAELRAAKEAKRQEPEAWNKSRLKAPRWALETGGLDALSPELKADAERAFSEWAKTNPDAAQRYPIGKYVEFRQQGAAEKAKVLKIASERRDENRARRKADRRGIESELAVYRKSCRDRLKAHAKEGCSRLQQLRQAAKTQKAAIRADRTTLWAIRRVQLQQVDRELAHAKKALREKLAIERVSLKPLSREQWVAMRAEVGDGRAIRQLRGWRYQNARLTKAAERDATQQPFLSAGDPSVEAPATWAMVSLARLRDQEAKRQKEISDAFKKLSHKFDRRTGDVRVLINGKDAVIDRGKLLNVVADTEAARVLALEMAINKFGSRLTATGSEEWRRSIALTAARNGIDVTFVDEAMNHILRGEQERLATEHGKALAAAAESRQFPVPTAVEVTLAKMSADQVLLTRIDTLQTQLSSGQLEFTFLHERQAAIFVASALSEWHENASGQLRRADQFLTDLWPKAQSIPDVRSHNVLGMATVTPLNTRQERRWKVTVSPLEVDKLGSGLQRLATLTKERMSRASKTQERGQRTTKEKGLGR